MSYGDSNPDLPVPYVIKVRGGGGISVDTIQMGHVEADLRRSGALLTEMVSRLETMNQKIKMLVNTHRASSVAHLVDPSQYSPAHVLNEVQVWNYEASYQRVSAGPSSPRQLCDNCVELANKVQVATHQYQQSETNLLLALGLLDAFESLDMALTETSLAPYALTRDFVSDVLSHMPEAPKKFHVGDRLVDTTKMDKVSCESLQLAYVMAWIGREQYGDKRWVYTNSKQGSKASVYPGLLQSPELEKTWGKFLRDGANELEKKKKEPILFHPPIITPGVTTMPPPPPPSPAALVIAAARAYLYNPQAKEQKEKMPSWDSSKTGKALGGTWNRLEPKVLNVPPEAAGASAGPKNLDAAVVDKDPTKRNVPLKASDMLRYADTVDPRDDGAIEIIRLDTNDGHRSWQVIMRGTERWDGGSIQPQDMLSNLEEVAELPSAQRHGAMQAMALAGIQKGDPVQIYGHSQAGIVAANLANDPQMQQKYNIVSVIDAGSPNNRINLPSNIEHTSFRNLEDPVWKLDCTLPANNDNRVNVYGNLHGEGFTGGHDRHIYAQMAQAVEDAKNPAYEAQQQRVAKRMHLTEGIKSAVSQRYEIGRQ